MPKNEKTPRRLEELTAEERQTFAYRYQEHWYLLASTLCKGCSVLDVGSGTGYGLPLYWAAGAVDVLGIDPLPAGPGVQRVPINSLRDNVYDIVTCFDVIEHVDDDVGFLNELLRVSGKCLILTTPNWNVWHCQEEFHVREYTPEELLQLLEKQEYLLWTCGKDRVASPVRPIRDLQEADATFCVLLRGSEASDAEWRDLLVQADTLHRDIPARLSSLTRNSEEWVSTAQALCKDAADPLDAALILLQWLKSVLCNPPRTAELKEMTDTIATLRYGLAGPLQQARSIAWVLNTFVIGPNGPKINHPRGIKAEGERPA